MRYVENDEEAVNPILLGQLPDGAGGHAFIGFDDDRHVVTVAGSRAGKGDSLIVPNLLSYRGSVICIDPKGENASVTAHWRAQALGQQVYVLDPFRVARVPESLRAAFNPLEWIDRYDPEAIEDVAALADAIIVQGNAKDPHWDESARTFIKGLILLSLGSAENPSDRSFDDIRRWSSIGVPDAADTLPSVTIMLEMMARSPHFEGALAAVGATLLDMAERERGSVLSTARRNLEFLDSAMLRTSLRGPSSFDPADFKRSQAGITLYLVLPEWRVATHARWLRMMIATLLHALERTPKRPGKPQPAVLFILEEFAALGYMQSIERAAGYIAGFGVKLWSVLQDFNQLKAHYPERWETFLGNAGILTAFGNVDTTTTKYLASRLGEAEITRTTTSETVQQGTGESGASMIRRLEKIFENPNPMSAFGSESQSASANYSAARNSALHKAELLTGSEISRLFSREQGTMLVLIAGLPPIRLLRLSAAFDPFFADRGQPNPFHS